MKKIVLSKEDKARLLERFNIANVKILGNNRVINIPCICNNYYYCSYCPFYYDRKSLYRDCLFFVEKHFGSWGIEIIGAAGIFWKVADDEKSLKFIADVRRWLNTLP